MATPRTRAVTVLEVLVIFAIIAFLAAFALPRWPVNRTLSQRSEAQARMHTMTSIIEGERARTGRLPAVAQWRESAGAAQVPVPEPMEARLTDPFSRGGWLPITYHLEDDRYLLASMGPDRDADFIPFPGWSRDESWRVGRIVDTLYDPTNGLASSGDIILRSWAAGGAR